MTHPRVRLTALLVLAILLSGLALMPARAAPFNQATPSAVPPSATSVPPSATSVPPSATSVPPSATSVPPSATSVPPSATSVPPSATVPAAPAQVPDPALRLAITKRLIGSAEVQVGQLLTFSIQITNTGSVVVTDLPVVDEYASDILQPLLDQIEPPPTSAAPGLLRWDNLTEVFGDLEPGRSVTITAVFRAIRIDDEVINRAHIEAAIGSGGEGLAPVEDAAGGTVRGGRVIVEKALVESFVQLDAPVISFTLSLRNDGFADIVRAPLADTYRADLLSFISASVPPDFHNPLTGELRWDDLLASLDVDRLAPQERISFTTTYSVTGPIEDAVVNRANAVNVADEFGNAVASPRQAEVRIRIRGPGGAELPTVTPTLTPLPQQEEQPRREPPATVTPILALTPTAAPATPIAAPASPTAVTATPAADAGAGAAAGGTLDPATEPIPTTLPATGAPARGLAPLGLALAALLISLLLRVVGQWR